MRRARRIAACGTASVVYCQWDRREKQCQGTSAWRPISEKGIEEELARLRPIFDKHAPDGEMNRRGFGELFAQLSLDLQQVPHELAPAPAPIPVVPSSAPSSTPAPPKQASTSWFGLFATPAPIDEGQQTQEEVQTEQPPPQAQPPPRRSKRERRCGNRRGPPRTQPPRAPAPTP